MTILISLLAFVLLAILLGKIARQKGTGWYVALIILTLLQVALASYELFLMPSPLS